MSMRKRFTVFGGDGFLGRAIVKALVNAASHNEVQIASRAPKIDSLRRLGRQIVDPMTVDIQDAQAVTEAVKRSDVVINLVGLMYGSKELFHNVMVKGALNIAQGARESSAKMIQLSAIGADPDSNLVYPRCKGLAERGILEACPDASIIRPSLVFGKDDSFFNRFRKLAKILQFLPAFGGGHARFAPVFVEDVAKAVIVAAGESVRSNEPQPKDGQQTLPDLNGKIVEAGGPDVFTYRELMRLTLETADLKRPVIPLPMALGIAQGAFLELFPPNLFTVTKEQIKQLAYDNVPEAYYTNGGFTGKSPVSQSAKETVKYPLAGPASEEAITNGIALTLQNIGLQPKPARPILMSYMRASSNEPRSISGKRTHSISPQLTADHRFDEIVRQVKETRKGMRPEDLAKEREVQEKFNAPDEVRRQSKV